MERKGTGRPQRTTESRKKGTTALGFTTVDLDGGARVPRGTARGGALLHVRWR